MASPKNQNMVTPRPTPKFYHMQESPLSTKKKRIRNRALALRSPRPDHLLVRTAPLCVTRNQARRFATQKAHFISFKSRSDTFLDRITSRHYDESSNESYFEQCFEIERKIGEGSFGEVFRVRSKEDGCWYAVKRAMDRFRNANDRQLKLTEVQKHELLPKHSNLVNFVRAWEESGRLYIQTELCDYSLSDYANKEHEIPENLLWKYFVDLLRAVKHLHDNDLLHLDIKPENIFITSDNVCKLGDFGLIFDLKMGDLTTAQEGDSKYLAPEILDGHIGKQADIYSLGMTMLELATDLDPPSSGQGWQMLRHGQLPDDMMSHLSVEMRRLIHMMMDVDSERRPTADQLLWDPAMQTQVWKRSLYLKFHEFCRWMRHFVSWLWLCLLSVLLFVLLPLQTLFTIQPSPSSGRKPSKRSPVSTPTLSPASFGHRRLRLDRFSDDDETVRIAETTKRRVAIAQSAPLFKLRISPVSSHCDDEDNSSSSSLSSPETHKRPKFLNTTPVIRASPRLRAAEQHRQLQSADTFGRYKRFSPTSTPTARSNGNTPRTAGHFHQQTNTRSLTKRDHVTGQNGANLNSSPLSPIPLNFNSCNDSPMRSRLMFDHGSSGEDI